MRASLSRLVTFSSPFGGLTRPNSTLFSPVPSGTGFSLPPALVSFTPRGTRFVPATVTITWFRPFGSFTFFCAAASAIGSVDARSVTSFAVGVTVMNGAIELIFFSLNGLKFVPRPTENGSNTGGSIVISAPTPTSDSAIWKPPSVWPPMNLMSFGTTILASPSAVKCCGTMPTNACAVMTSKSVALASASNRNGSVTSSTLASPSLTCLLPNAVDSVPASLYDGPAIVSDTSPWSGLADPSAGPTVNFARPWIVAGAERVTPPGPTTDWACVNVPPSDVMFAGPSGTGTGSVTSPPSCVMLPPCSWSCAPRARLPGRFRWNWPPKRSTDGSITPLSWSIDTPGMPSLPNGIERLIRKPVLVGLTPSSTDTSMPTPMNDGTDFLAPPSSTSWSNVFGSLSGTDVNTRPPFRSSNPATVGILAENLPRSSPRILVSSLKLVKSSLNAGIVRQPTPAGWKTAPAVLPASSLTRAWTPLASGSGGIAVSVGSSGGAAGWMSQSSKLPTLKTPNMTGLVPTVSCSGIATFSGAIAVFAAFRIILPLVLFSPTSLTAPEVPNLGLVIVMLPSPPVTQSSPVTG